MTASRRWLWRAATRARGRSECVATAPAHTTRAHGARPKFKAREVGETNLLTHSGNVRALPAFPCSRAKLPHGVSYIFPPPRPFSPACSPPPSCFLARALQSRAQRDRFCTRVVAQLPHPSGNKPRRQNWPNLCTEKAGYILTPPRFTSAESLSSCCGSVAALALFF